MLRHNHHLHDNYDKRQQEEAWRLDLPFVETDDAYKQRIFAGLCVAATTGMSLLLTFAYWGMKLERSSGCARGHTNPIMMGVSCIDPIIDSSGWWGVWLVTLGLPFTISVMYLMKYPDRRRMTPGEYAVQQAREATENAAQVRRGE